MKCATSWVHIDTAGFATAVDSVAGSKYWVLLKPRNHANPKDHTGDLSSMYAFGPNWDPSGAGTDAFEFEAVVLRAGSLL
jgi:hypothetical protein